MSYIMSSAPGSEAVINNKKVLYFAGTSYYCLHDHPEIIKTMEQATREYGTHTATSRAGFGNSPLIDLIEKKASRFFGTEDSAYISTGFLTNTAAIEGLAQLLDIEAIIIDRNAHYSAFNAAYAINRPVKSFASESLNELEKLLIECNKSG